MAINAETFFLDDRAGGTLQHRIKRFVVDGVLSGRFQPGERMPSSRALANRLGVSRITVTLAYTDLVADDYLTSRGRSGYFVSDTAPAAPSFPMEDLRDTTEIDWSRFLAHRPEPPDAVTRPSDWQSYPFPFIYGQADPTLFDSQNWRLCALQALGQKDFDALTSDQYERDDPLLVDFIRRHILPRRGIKAAPEEILITMGAQNALWLAAQLLLTQRRTAVVENPGYPGLRDILAQTRCHTAHVDVDAEGLNPDRLPETLDVLFATVSHQCPTNATMPVERRRALLERAARDGFLIVEDDYEFELTFERSPSPSLKSMDDAGAVIHVGSFSKSLFPGLRLGYLVAARPFVAEARRLRGTVLRHPPGLVQRTAANFLSLGHYDAQINRMRGAFQRRRKLMQTAIAEHGLMPAGDMTSGGSCFWMCAPDHVDTADLARRLYARGVVIEPGAAFFQDPAQGRPFYRLAYSSIASARIPKGIEIIADTIRQLD
ncbi:aminotransferase class I/II-fold pyridoxal phosphate-dependent enzyme [Alphaproteobacteria bacterium GH1-50]|uniref:Aminotransferase class I/II-fold pyridoxal phosphate-dependent enzyme n=1 Tax=Kangsaoukella pontilimi TaxID=2691042 RepID=A0A7C9IFD2_9RHOB|nr:PLP-dependent aminotransferase family protein [Kangsaoukella pontilimi]MXQ07287.1 aminotransferase class I/II-fold pyridoxal phosphate-dependent enzyme [Kangsaoukella pontilimi]